MIYPKNNRWRAAIKVDSRNTYDKACAIYRDEYFGDCDGSKYEKYNTSACFDFLEVKTAQKFIRQLIKEKLIKGDIIFGGCYDSITPVKYCNEHTVKEYIDSHKSVSAEYDGERFLESAPIYCYDVSLTRYYTKDTVMEYMNDPQSFSNIDCGMTRSSSVRGVYHVNSSVVSQAVSYKNRFNKHRFRY